MKAFRRGSVEYTPALFEVDGAKYIGYSAPWSTCRDEDCMSEPNGRDGYCQMCTAAHDR